MRINTNRWNRIRYTLYTPVYDSIARLFSISRRKSIESLQVKSGEKILIIGAGTGLDLEFLPGDCEITATDITPAMVERIRKRNLTLNRHLTTLIMDGQSLDFEDQTFDKVVLHLILAVIPDPIACIQETERVLKKGGSVVIFDKFVRTGRKVSLSRRMANLVANFLATDITRDLESILKNSGLKVVSDEEADLNGNFRLIKLIK
jgi:ubiquinone/menaquinone biosynthesis C-methylase UbiE